MSGDGDGMGKNDSPDGHLGLGGSVTCIRLFVPLFLGRPVLESVVKVGSIAERLQSCRLSLLDVARCRG